MIQKSLVGGGKTPVKSKNYNLKKFFLISLIFSVFIFNSNAYSQSPDRSYLISACNELTQTVKYSTNCSNMSDREIKDMLASIKDKIKEVEAQQAYLNFCNEYNKAKIYDDYTKICEKLYTVFPDHKQCHEFLPSFYDCIDQKASMEKLKTGVEKCFEVINGKNLTCQYGDSALLKAVCEQNYAKVKEALSKENINVTNSSDENALHLAVKRNNLDILNLLLENNINVNAEDYHGKTPLYYAAGNNKYEMVKKLLEKGAYDKEGHYSDGGYYPSEITSDNDIAELLLEYHEKNKKD